MKNITVRGFDNALSAKLKADARKQGKSVNQVILDSLRQHHGLEKEKKFTRVYDDLDALFGRWSPGDFDAIQATIEGQRRIDPELWEEAPDAD